MTYTVDDAVTNTDSSLVSVDGVALTDVGTGPAPTITAAPSVPTLSAPTTRPSVTVSAPTPR